MTCYQEITRAGNHAAPDTYLVLNTNPPSWMRKVDLFLELFDHVNAAIKIDSYDLVPQYSSSNGIFVGPQDLRI